MVNYVNHEIRNPLNGMMGLLDITKMSLEEHQSRKGKTYKLLLIFAMISILMIFAGLTSAYVVSKSRPDWLSDFVLPSAFVISTVVIVTSSITFYFND